MTVVSSYDHIFSRGVRSGTNGNGFLVSVTRSAALAAIEFAPWTEAFDAFGSGPFYDSGATLTGVDHFTFRFSSAVAITGIRFWGEGGDITDLGMWQLKGSNDGSSFTNIASPFHWNQVNNGIGSLDGCVFEFSNTVAYLYYRLSYVSGTFGGGRLCTKVDLRIAHSDRGGGDRSSTVVISRSGLAPSPQPLSDLIDGKYFAGLPVPGTDQVSLLAPANGNYLEFDFGIPVSIRRWRLNNDGQLNQNYGTWRWQGSASGSSFANSGVTFTLNNTTNTKWDWLLTTQVPVSTDFFRYWRLTSSGDASNLDGLYEIVFDLVEGAVEENPVAWFEDDTEFLAAITSEYPEENPVADFIDDSIFDAIITSVAVETLVAEFVDDTQFLAAIEVEEVHLVAEFVDDATFIAIPENQRSPIVQTIIIVTGM